MDAIVEQLKSKRATMNDLLSVGILVASFEVTEMHPVIAVSKYLLIETSSGKLCPKASMKSGAYSHWRPIMESVVKLFEGTVNSSVSQSIQLHNYG